MRCCLRVPFEFHFSRAELRETKLKKTRLLRFMFIASNTRTIVPKYPAVPKMYRQ